MTPVYPIPTFPSGRPVHFGPDEPLLFAAELAENWPDDFLKTT